MLIVDKVLQEAMSSKYRIYTPAEISNKWFSLIEKIFLAGAFRYLISVYSGSTYLALFMVVGYTISFVVLFFDLFTTIRNATISSLERMGLENVIIARIISSIIGLVVGLSLPLIIDFIGRNPGNF